MLIHFTRLTKERHRFAIERQGLPDESRDLETRSYLVHDLVHFVVERTLGRQYSFYGLLARGTSLCALSDRTKPWPEGSELADTEGLVARLQGPLTGRGALPPWAFVPDVVRGWRSVHGQWRGTRFGATCTFRW